MDLVELKIKLMRFPVVGKRFFRKWILNREGGEKESRTLRTLTWKYNRVAVDDYSYGGCFDYRFNLGGTVYIGKYCSFATNIHYFGGNHPMDYASMSPYFYNRSFGFDVKDIERKVLTIGNDVWCGYGVIITNKCTKIGNGAVIAAGSVVTHDVPPYAIVAGNPAKLLRYRFEPEIISELEKSKWYELNPTELMEYYDSISNPAEFSKRIIEDRGDRK